MGFLSAAAGVIAGEREVPVCPVDSEGIVFPAEPEVPEAIIFPAEPEVPGSHSISVSASNSSSYNFFQKFQQLE